MSADPKGNDPASVHVLVVDDDHYLRALLRDVLRDEGYTVQEAPDGQVALELLRQRPERWVVLTDHLMPRLSGAKLIAAVVADRQLRTQHAFIYMTAVDRVLEPELRTQLETLQAPVLGKPFALEACLTAVAASAKRLAPAT
jgi:CheY-like chemotaxis protein